MVAVLDSIGYEYGDDSVFQGNFDLLWDQSLRKQDYELLKDFIQPHTKVRNIPSKINRFQATTIANVNLNTGFLKVCEVFITAPDTYKPAVLIRDGLKWHDINNLCCITSLCDAHAYIYQ